MNLIENLDWSILKEHLQNRASSESAKSLLQKLEPQPNVESAELLLNEILDAKETLKEKTRPLMESLDLYPVWINRLKKQAILTPLEIKDIRLFLIESINLKDFLENGNSWALKITNNIFEAQEALSAIDQILTPSGDIKNTASEKLYKLFNNKRQLQEQIRKELDKQVKRHKMEPLLQDKYVTNREGRWVLPIKSGMQHDFDGIIHDTSHSKQTVFMEPQSVIQLNNTLKYTESEISNEIHRLITQLSYYLSSLSHKIEKTYESMLEADIRFAQAIFSIDTNSQSFSFSENSLILKSVKHPLLVLNSESNVVPNDFKFPEDKRILLLSGPNAGGKTIFLKSVGLAAQMARCGLPILADADSKIPFFTTIHAIIGDAQDMKSSTFAGHLSALNKAIKLKGKNHLILIDEICSSTDPEEGVALSRSFIEEFSRNKTYTFVTSHLSPLKEGWKNLPILTASMDFDMAQSMPTYQLLMNVSGQSLAFKTAERVGVKNSILKRAMDLLSPTSKKRHEILSELNEQHENLRRAHHLLQEDKKNLEQLKKEYQKKLNDFENEKEEELKKLQTKAEENLEKLYKEIKEKRFEKNKIADYKRKIPKVLKRKQNTDISDLEEFCRLFPPGKSGYSKSLKQHVILQSTPNAQGEIFIQSGSMRLKLHWTDITKSNTQNNTLTQPIDQRTTYTEEDSYIQDSIDLRGYTAMESIELLEKKLDEAIQSDKGRVKIIHGHGTLKKTVRQFLSRIHYVKKWSAGDSYKGEDGITWVDM